MVENQGLDTGSGDLSVSQRRRYGGEFHTLPAEAQAPCRKYRRRGHRNLQKRVQRAE